MKRHELSDREWDLLAEFFPPRPRRRGGRWRDDRAMANAIFWRLSTGAAWRDLPDRYGPWQTVYHRFNALRRSGAIDRMVERLQLRLDAAGLIDHRLYLVDGTNVRVAREAVGGEKPGPPASRPTTPSGVAGAGSGAKYIWCATPTGCRWRSW
jgi:transposase